MPSPVPSFVLAPSPGEATHFYHLALDTVFSNEARLAGPWKSDCMLPLVKAPTPSEIAAERGISARPLDERGVARIESQADVDAGYELERQDAAAGHP